MKTQKIVKPGQPGTKKWMEKYGENLICIRYKIDTSRNCRIKTAEIILDKKPITVRSRRIPYNKLVSIKIQFNNIYLRKLIIAAGGKWNISKKIWLLPYGKVMELGLEKNMLDNLEL
ncbi:MAG: hypothetical protein JXN64_13845 [Spirochaetes bacterium]|nr:hypothetical protein [Spirochaetota bacterium]